MLLRNFSCHRAVRGAIGLGLLAGATAAASYAYFVEPAWLDVRRVDVPVTGLAANLDGFLVAQLSDFHIGVSAITNDLVTRAINECNNVKPDLVALTGDYVTRRDAISCLANNLKQLQVRPAVAVLGNHDYRFGPRHRRELIRLFEELNITLLQNQAIRLSHRGESVWVVGVSDAYTSHDQVHDAIGEVGCEPGPRILLSHFPDALLDYPQGQFSLALSGHTHGAQVNLPIVSKIALAKSDTRFSHGMYDVAGTPLYVNRGLGMSTYPARLFARPEVTLLTLRRAPGPG